MRVNLISNNTFKRYLSITFIDEIEEHIFLKNILALLGKKLPVHCMITDLDTSYLLYEKYFKREKYYVFDRLTTVSIFAFELDATEIQNVISNWGYYTIDAIFALGVLDNDVKNPKLDSTNILKSMPIVIAQVLDNSIEIAIDQCYFKDVSQFLVSI